MLHRHPHQDHVPCEPVSLSVCFYVGNPGLRRLVLSRQFLHLRSQLGQLVREILGQRPFPFDRSFRPGLGCLHLRLHAGFLSFGLLSLATPARRGADKFLDSASWEAVLLLLSVKWICSVLWENKTTLLPENNSGSFPDNRLVVLPDNNSGALPDSNAVELPERSSGALPESNSASFPKRAARPDALEIAMR